MDLEWLEDFLAVIEAGGFSRAAEVRHVTQPALSRRIQALEEWVGTALFHRTTHSVTLAPAGEAFRASAEDLLRRFAASRAEAVERASRPDALRFASTNALSLTFFPPWLRRIEDQLALSASIQLVANHMQACERLMLRGHVQFLLCHHHRLAQTALGPADFSDVCVGTDLLIPVTAPVSPGDLTALHALPGTERAPTAWLNYSPESGMGRILAAVRSSAPAQPMLRPVFSSHVAKLLVTMALERRGMAWLPRSLIEDHLATSHLVRAGDDRWDVPIEVHLFRSKVRQPAVAEQFWNHVVATAP